MSEEDAMKVSFQVVTLIAFADWEFIKDCRMKGVENICPKQKQEFANVCLACNLVVWKLENVSSDFYPAGGKI